MNAHNYNGRSAPLGAALAATVPQSGGLGGQRSSGLFNLPAMNQMPPMRLQRVPSQPRIYGPPPVPMFARSFQVHAPLIRELRPQGERYGIGWFGVFVTWVATMALGTLFATNLPAHVKGHARLIAAALPAPPTPAPAAAPVATGAPVVVPMANPSTPAVATAGTLAAASTARPATAPPEIGVSELPRAPAIAMPVAPRPVATQVHTRRSAAHAARPAAPSPAADDADEEEAPAAAPPPKAAHARRAAPPPASDDDTSTAAPAPPPKPVAEAAPPPPKPAPAATFAAGSLEDLIKKEVDKEQKKLHHQ
jgi:hypothetical protein